MYDTNNPNFPGGEDLKPYSGSFLSMGTVISIKVFVENKKEADKIYEDVKAIYDAYDNAADDGFDSVFGQTYDGEVARLNRDGSIEASDELVELLEFALDMSDRTNGYFNPLMGKLNHEWKIYMDNMGTIPSQGEIDIYLYEIANTKITIAGNLITKEGNALVDLGGIAKGYATYKAEEYLKANGHKYYLINAGSSNIALGEYPGDEKYNVALSYVYGYPNNEPKLTKVDGYLQIDDIKTDVEVNGNAKLNYGVGFPETDGKEGDIYFSTKYAMIYQYQYDNVENKKKWVSVKQLYLVDFAAENLNVVTSSPGEQNRWDGKGLVHHLISPKTGYPRGYKDTNDIDSITLIGNNGGILDSYSTALFVMPLEEAKKFMAENDISGMITKDGKIIYNNSDVI